MQPDDRIFKKPRIDIAWQWKCPNCPFNSKTALELEDHNCMKEGSEGVMGASAHGQDEARECQVTVIGVNPTVEVEGVVTRQRKRKVIESEKAQESGIKGNVVQYIRRDSGGAPRLDLERPPLTIKESVSNQKVDLPTTAKRRSRNKKDDKEFNQGVLEEQKDEVSYGVAAATASSIDAHDGGKEAEDIGTAAMKKNYMCHSCSFTTDKKNLYDDHILIHGKDGGYQCTQCRFTSNTQTQLFLHMQKHQLEQLNSTLEYHNLDLDRSGRQISLCPDINPVESVEVNGVTLFKCSICDFISAVKREVSVHMRVHSSEKPFKCAICSYRTAKSDDLLVHMKAHPSDQIYNSTVESQFTVHAREQSYDVNHCHLCDYVASDNEILKAHMRVTHRIGDSVFRCEVCNYTTVQKHNLRRHLRRHDIYFPPKS